MGTGACPTSINFYRPRSPAVRYLTLHTPGGFDLFVRELSEAAAGSGPVDAGALRAVTARHHIEMLGPGVSPAPLR